MKASLFSLNGPKLNPMKRIDVFDPALSAFATDVEWARGQGAQVERYNLAQQPMVFASETTVKAALERGGEAALPLVLVDGQPRVAGRYPQRDEIAQGLAGTRPAPVARVLRPVGIPVAAAPPGGC